MDNPRSRLPLRSRIFRALRVPAALLGTVVLYVAVVGIDIDVSPQGNEIAAKLAAALGREVRIAGAVQLEVSARPKLRAGGLHIANGPGFSGEAFATLGEARLTLNLLPLLWGRLQIEELAGSDARLRLQTRKDGASNWTFRKKAAPAAASAPPASAPASAQALALLDVRRLALEGLDVQYVGPDGTSHYFNLESLVAHLPSDRPITVSLKGTVEKTFPYRVDFTGGSLADLLTGSRSWPIALSLEFLSSELTLRGTVTGTRGDLRFGIATQDLKELERLLQTRLPAVGQTRVAGDVKFAPGHIALANLSGNLGNTTFSGALEIDRRDARPRLQGELSLPVLDLRPFLTGRPATEEESTQSLAEIYRDLAQATFDLHALNLADANLTLRVGKWLNLPGAVHDAILKVRLDHGRLTMPVRATMADTTLSGTVHADARKAPARFEVALGTRDSSIGNLAGLLLGAPAVRGQLGGFDLRIAARGNRGAELMESLVVRLGVERAKLSYGNRAGARPVQFTLDKFMLELPAGAPLHGEAQGTLVDNAFTMSLNGSSLTELLEGARASLDFALQAGSSRTEVHAVMQPPSETSGTDVRFSLQAPHSSEISSWLGLEPAADVPVSIQGRLLARNHGWSLSGLGFELGRSRLSAEVQQSRERNRPLVKLQLTGELIDADELKSLLPESPPAARTRPTPFSAALIDLPVLPRGISLADADITVRIKKIATKSPFPVRALSFDGRIRDGMMDASPFAANVAGTDFDGTILLDLRTQQPRAALRLSGGAMNIGRLLRQLDIARDIDAHVGRLRLHLDLRSSRLRELLAQSTLEASFDGGHLDLHDANTGGAMHIALDAGELRSAPGTPVRLGLKGTLDKIPVTIGIETATAADLLNPVLPIPFALDADTPGASLRLSGDVARPFSQQAVELALDVRGNRLDKLNALLRTSLPPWGPWSAAGKFRVSPSGYELPSLLLQVGSSRLAGHGRLDTRAVPPRLDVEFTAPTIQIDDFRLGNWSPEKKPAATGDPAARRAGEADAHVRQLLSRDTLTRQNVRLVVRVDQVLSGNDVLGNGSLEIALQDGRADIGPAVVNTAGGTAMIRLDYEPGEKDVALNLRAEARHFDYGILARRIDRRSDMRGTFDLDVDVSARAQNLSELLHYGKGRIDFALWPENMKSGVLDLWAVNVLMALLPAVDTSNESKVNCAIGQFRLQDGRLTHRRILVDTTRMRVSGKGNADFATERLLFYMRPRAKTPQFLSFPLPVEVSGTFRDFSVGVRPGDVLETAGQVVTSFFSVPLQSMFGKTLPADGKDVCRLR